VRQLIQAHSYWRMKGLTVRPGHLNEDTSVYRDALPDRITGLMASGIEAQLLDKPGGIFVRRLEQFADEDRVLLQCAARIVLEDDNGTLAEQLEQRGPGAASAPAGAAPARRAHRPARTPAPRELIFPNGYRRLHPGRPRICHHPAARADHPGAVGQCAGQPAVRHGGQRERQSAYTWYGERPRVPPDALEQRSGLRTQRRGDLHARRADRRVPGRRRPGPAAARSPTSCRHGFGYTVFEHDRGRHRLASCENLCGDGRAGEVLVLKVRNVSGRSRAWVCPPPVRMGAGRPALANA
jgi:cyclic beta-1,2-glucan synthetase